MTEKDYNPNQKENKAMKKQESLAKTETPKTVVKEEKKAEEKKVETKKEVKKQETKIVKKDSAFVRGKDLPMSTKVGCAIGRFIKNKKIEDAIKDLEQVTELKKAVPMRGEIPHRKGKIMSGRFPKKAAKEVIILLKSLKGNTVTNNMDDPIIKEVVANKAARPMAKRGSVQKKRTHMLITVKEISEKKEKAKKKKKVEEKK
jgi:ribosomal protein L22